jgi:hypothetical protein
MTRTSATTVLPKRGTLLDLRNSVRRMPAGGQFKELRVTICRLLWKTFLRNKYGLKKPGDFIVSEGHGYPLVQKNKKAHEIVFLLSPNAMGIVFHN